MKKFILLLLISTVLLSACSKEANYVVEEEISVYFEKFEAAAAERGHEIDLKAIHIEGYFSDIEANGVVGQCKTYSDGTHDIVIEKTYWNRKNDLEKEYLIFHELGHCVLNREHLDNQDQQGNCISMMQSGTSNCDDNYTTSTIENYLDELFKE